MRTVLWLKCSHQINTHLCSESTTGTGSQNNSFSLSRYSDMPAKSILKGGGGGGGGTTSDMGGGAHM